MPLGLAAVSGAARAFLLGTPSLKHQGGSAAKRKDCKPRQGLQRVTPQPRRSPASASTLHPLGLQRPAAAGRPGSGSGWRRARAEQTHPNAVRRCQPAPGPLSLPAQQRPMAPPAAGGAARQSCCCSPSLVPSAGPFQRDPGDEAALGTLRGGMRQLDFVLSLTLWSEGQEPLTPLPPSARAPSLRARRVHGGSMGWVGKGRPGALAGPGPTSGWQRWG